MGKAIIFALLAFAFLFAHDASATRGAQSSITKYDLNFSFDFQAKKVFCNGALTINGGDTLNLLLYRLLTVRSIRDSNGHNISFTQQVTAFTDWDQMQVKFQKVKKQFEKNSKAVTIPIGDYGPNQLTDLSYSKGMLFFYVLHKKLGEEKMMASIANYYHKFKAGATLKDFSACLQVKALTDEWLWTAKSSEKIISCGTSHVCSKNKPSCNFSAQLSVITMDQTTKTYAPQLLYHRAPEPA